MFRAAIFLLTLSLTQASLALLYPFTPRSFLLPEASTPRDRC